MMPNKWYIILKSYLILRQDFRKIKGPKDTASLLGNDRCLKDGAQLSEVTGEDKSKTTICFKTKWLHMMNKDIFYDLQIRNPIAIYRL